jgi:IclR family transcriptional regulator, KDG regulon repressor
MPRKKMIEEPEEEDIKELVQSIERAISVIETLSDYPDGLGVTEIAKLNGLYKSSVHRILTTLVFHNYAEQVPASEKYYLSYKIFELAHKLLSNNHLVKIAAPWMNKLQTETKESVSLVLIDHSQNKLIVCDERLSRQAVSTRSEIGRSLPLSNDASTSVYLAGLTNEELHEVLKSSVNKLKSDKGSFREIKGRLHYVREAGYAINWGEDDNDVTSVAAPIYDREGTIIAILRLVVPTFRINEDETEKYTRITRECAAEISKRLGYFRK